MFSGQDLIRLVSDGFFQARCGRPSPPDGASGPSQSAVGRVRQRFVADEASSLLKVARGVKSRCPWRSRLLDALETAVQATTSADVVERTMTHRGLGFVFEGCRKRANHGKPSFFLHSHVFTSKISSAGKFYDPRRQTWDTHPMSLSLKQGGG